MQHQSSSMMMWWRLKHLLCHPSDAVSCLFLDSSMPTPLLQIGMHSFDRACFLKHSTYIILCLGTSKWAINVSFEFWNCLDYSFYVYWSASLEIPDIWVILFFSMIGRSKLGWTKRARYVVLFGGQLLKTSSIERPAAQGHQAASTSIAMHHPNGNRTGVSGGKTSTRDEEELDKLLLGLDKLTETLPDLTNNSISSKPTAAQ